MNQMFGHMTTAVCLDTRGGSFYHQAQYTQLSPVQLCFYKLFPYSLMFGCTLFWVSAVSVLFCCVLTAIVPDGASQGISQVELN